MSNFTLRLYKRERQSLPTYPPTLLFPPPRQQQRPCTCVHVKLHTWRGGVCMQRFENKSERVWISVKAQHISTICDWYFVFCRRTRPKYHSFYLGKLTTLELPCDTHANNGNDLLISYESSRKINKAVQYK